MKNLGKFTRYLPEKVEENQKDVLFLKNEQQKDWYTLIAEIQTENSLFCLVDQTGKILQTTKEASTLFPENLSVYQLPANTNTQKGYLLAGRIQEIPMTLCQQQALDRIATLHARFINDMSGNARTEERDTWMLKKLAASALLEGKASPAQTNMLKREAEALQQTPEKLAQAILKKADLYQKYIGVAAALKKKYQTQIRACQNVTKTEKTLKAFQQEITAAYQA